MSVHATEPERLEALRSRAAARLTGTAATKGPTARAADALAVLHALASSPGTAAEALTLLHELQVHQVELDLQAQELHESRVELESALRRQIERYDLQPVGCFTIDARLVLHELNQTGADMLGIGRDNACGMGLDAFLGGQSAALLRSTLASLDAVARRPVCRLSLQSKGGSDRPVLANMAKIPSTAQFLLTLANAEDGQERQTAIA